jgi:hypothetical protein
VIFGTRNSEPVIFKYFCTDERKARELYALRHFAPTGLVPTILAEEGARLVVQSRIPGGWLPDPDYPKYSSVDAYQAGYSLGQATAKLLATPLTTEDADNYENRYYEGWNMKNYLRDISEAAALIHAKIPAYRGPLFTESLAAIEATLPYLMSQPRLLYHQDAMNMHFVESTFAGFFDLEMCRVGTEAMQIGSLWTVFATHNNWSAFVQGYAGPSQRLLVEIDFNAAKAFADFLVWRYITRYGRWRGDLSEIADPSTIEADAVSYEHSLLLNRSVSS